MRKIFVFMCAFFFSFCLLAAEKAEDLISLDFRAAPIEDVLRTIAKQSGYNIIMSENVKGNITIHLEDVTPLDAIDAVTTINGFTYTKKGKVFKVTTPEEAEKEKEVTKVFRLNNAKPEEIKDALKSITEKVEINTRSNSIIVTDTPTTINQVTDIIKRLDVETPQVLIEAMFVETNLKKDENLGIDWTIATTVSGAKRPTTFPFNKNSKELDKYYPYVTPVDTGSIGDFPSWGHSLPFDGNPYGFPYAAAADFAFGTLDFSQLSSVLNLLKKRTKTRLISNPKILTLDNKEANIHVGTKYYIPEYDYSTDTGTKTISDYYETDIGMALQVTPHINPGGRIRLELNPSISTITGYTGPDNERPILYTREADTEVIIGNGGTVVIGGLIKNETSKTVNKIPILGDIPLLGALFKNEQSPEANNEKTELLIFITVHILGTNKKIKPEDLDVFTRRDLRRAIKTYHVHFEGMDAKDIKGKRVYRGLLPEPKLEKKK